MPSRALSILIALITVCSSGTSGYVVLRREVRATHAVVAAGRSYSADAGAAILTAGGTAIDAGVATIFAAAAVEISHFGLGGEAPIIIYSARDRRVVVINGQGPAPRAASPATFAGRASIPGNGPLGATVPAAVDAAALALSRFGTRSLGEVLAPAIALADGFPMYEFLRRYLLSERAACEPYPWTMRTYYPDGRVPASGEMFRQPNLARTLRAMADAERLARAGGASREEAIRAGRDVFYTGDVARRIVAASRDAGGLFTEADLAGYEGRVEEPASTTYRGYAVYKAGFWSQGPALLQTLNLLEGFDLRSMGQGSADALHTTTEAVKLAFADRDRYYADPDFAQVPSRALLSAGYTAERRKLIDPQHASGDQRPGDPSRYATEVRLKPDATTEVRLEPDATDGRSTSGADWRSRGPAAVNSALTARPSGPPGISVARPFRAGTVAHESGDTTAIEIVDAAGNLFSSTPSSGWLLGGAFVAGDTGVPLSNRMQAFRLTPDSPNVVAGGKRPRTTLTPTIVLKDGQPFLAIGTPGGDNQDQQILLVLLNVIDFGMDLQTAIEAPRINSLHPQSSFDRHEAAPNVLEVEATLPADIVAALQRRGHEVRLRPAYGVSTGVVAAGIDPVTRTLRGGADPRRERYIVGW